jgi:hypothetical protein
MRYLRLNVSKWPGNIAVQFDDLPGVTAGLLAVNRCRNQNAEEQRGQGA